MTPDDASRAESLRSVIDAVADVEWAQARDRLLGDMASWLRTYGHDGGVECWTFNVAKQCGACDLIRRYEELTQPPAPVMDAYRARFGDLGGAEP